jgi:hypothetical protein
MRNLKTKQRKHPKKTGLSNPPEPPWLHDDPNATRIPYTEEELDKLVQGFIAGNGDSKAWKELVRTHGFYGAREILRDIFIKRDPNIDDERIN